MSSIFRSLSTTPRVPNPIAPAGTPMDFYRDTGVVGPTMGGELVNLYGETKGPGTGGIEGKDYVFFSATPSGGGGGLPYVAPTTGGAGGSTGSIMRSFTQPLAGVVESLGVKDKITASIIAGAIMLIVPGALVLYLIIRALKRK